MRANVSEGHRPDLTPSLVSKLRAGDGGAGAMLDQLYRRPMMRFCWGYLGRAEDAEDAVQDVFCKVLRAAEVPENFRAWMYKIARNHCRNILRGRARRQDAWALPPDLQLDADTTGDLTRLVNQELRSRMVYLVSALPAAQREVLRLRYAEGLSRAEIAYVLEMPESLVKSRLFEGLKKLREHTSLLDDH
jgi:RNA polymerase sigma-70 factor (ECF subfamily)